MGGSGTGFARLVLVFVCALVAACGAHARGAHEDQERLSECAHAQTAQEIAKCKKRQGVAQLPHGDSLGKSALDVLAKMDSLGMGETGKPNAVQATYTAAVTNGLQHLEVAHASMRLRQGEIDQVAQELIPTAHETAKRHFELGPVLSKLVREAVVRAQSLSTNSGLAAYLEREQSLIALGDRLGVLKNKIELGQMSLDEASLLQSQATSRRAEIDDELDDVAFVQTGSLSRTDAALHLIDQVIESIHESRDHLREQSAVDEETFEAAMDRHQSLVESLMQNAGQFAASATANLAHAQYLRKYLKSLTATQFTELERYTLLQNKIQNVAGLFDSMLRTKMTSFPLFDQLAFALKNGDVAYNRTTNPHACVDDACGVCGGSGQSCVACDGVSGSRAVVSVCATCRGASNSSSGAQFTCGYFCDGKPNSGKTNDICGVCDGDGTSCMGCDGIVLSGKVHDGCGVCGGDGSSCAVRRGCLNAVCPSETPKCPVGQRVTSEGYNRCCFDPKLDCVPTAL